MKPGFSPGYARHRGCALKGRPTRRTRGAIPNWRSTPTLQYSNTLGWLRFCGQLSGRFVVPKGRIGLCPEGDWMIVARQFIAWNTPKKGGPSRRDDVSWATPHIRRPWSKNVLSTESYRSLRDGFFVWHTPGNKLPGYDHSVPPGQKTLNACPRIRRRITPRGRIRGRGRGRGRERSAW